MANDPTGNPPSSPGGDWWRQPDQPTTPYGAPPGYGPPGYGPPQVGPPPPPPPPGNRRKGWLLGGAAALAVALIGTAGALVMINGGDPEAGARDETPPASSAPESTAPEPSAPAATAPVPTGSFTDRLTTSSPTAKPSAPERKRTLKDVDAGLLVYDDVYVKPAKGWKRQTKSKRRTILAAPGRGAFIVVVEPFGADPSATLRAFTEARITDDRLTAVRKSAVRSVRPANSNIGGQAMIDYSGRARADGVSISIVARCTTMTGVESIHNVTVTSCLIAIQAERAAAFRESASMFASVARSI